MQPFILLGLLASLASAAPTANVDLPEGITAEMLPPNADLATMPIVDLSTRSTENLEKRQCGGFGQCVNGRTCQTYCSNVKVPVPLVMLRVY